MRYPITICSHNRLVIAPRGWFDGIGELDTVNGVLKINVNNLGPAGLKWLLDADGRFYKLTWLGLESETFIQKLRLAKRIERYSLLGAREIKASELAVLIQYLDEAYEGAPNAADLRNLLKKMAPIETLNRDFMQVYLGE